VVLTTTSYPTTLKHRNLRQTNDVPYCNAQLIIKPKVLAFQTFEVLMSSWKPYISHTHFLDLLLDAWKKMTPKWWFHVDVIIIFDHGRIRKNVKTSHHNWML